MNQAERFLEAFNTLRADNLHILDSLYDKNIHFQDPVGTHKGLDVVKDYFKKLYANVSEISFEKMDLISSGNEHVFVWKMMVKSKSLNNGDWVIVEGNSVIKFDENDRVTYHRDYFDLGALIYEDIPILGWIIRKIRTKMG